MAEEKNGDSLQIPEDEYHVPIPEESLTEVQYERTFYNDIECPSVEHIGAFGRRLVKIQAYDVNVKSVALRLKRLRINNVHEGIFSGKGEVFFTSTITDGVSSTPIQVVETQPWKNVVPGQFVDIIDPGIILYMSPAGKIPKFLDWRFLIMEDDSGTRHAGDLLTQVGQDANFTSISDAVTNLLSAANPLLSAVIGLADEAFQLVGAILKLNQDDFIGKAAVTYTREFDNYGVPAGQLSRIFPNDTGLVRIGDADLSYEILLGY